MRAISTTRRRELSSDFSLQGKTPKKIHAFLIETFGEYAPSYSIVEIWVAQFKRGDFSTCDVPRCGITKNSDHPGDYSSNSGANLERPPDCGYISSWASGYLSWVGWFHRSWRLGHAETLCEVGPEMPECRSNTSRVRIPKDQTINAEYYSSLLVQLKDIFKETLRGKFTKLVLFLHDNSPAHRALETPKKMAYLGFQCLVHPP